MDIPGIFVYFIAVKCFDFLRLQDRSKTENYIKRRPEFVAHIRQKTRLDFAGFVGAIFFPFEINFYFLALLDLILKS